MRVCACMYVYIKRQLFLNQY
uniref:Uncharacterized protein n=1 Tax=Anguilla anguilla TaxID=7936 RepID=A0A0E9XN48_ANGAN